MTDIMPYIYADNAATTPLSPRALEAMTPHLTRSFGNPSGIHRMAREAAVALGEARGTMARLLGAEHAGEIYFTSGGSESDNWILRGAVRRFRDAYGERAVPHIVTSAIEHHAILHCCQALEAEGVRVTYLPVDAQGRVHPSELGRALEEHDAREVSAGTNAPAALVSIMLANNEVGTIEPVRELAAIAHAHGAPFHTDAVQAVGHIPVDVRELDVDALSLSAHKFHGPRGIGALYLREGFSIPPLIAGGAQERGERAGTENLAGIVGMATALRPPRARPAQPAPPNHRTSSPQWASMPQRHTAPCAFPLQATSPTKTSPSSASAFPLASARRASSAPRGNGPPLNSGPPPVDPLISSGAKAPPSRPDRVVRRMTASQDKLDEVFRIHFEFS